MLFRLTPCHSSHTLDGYDHSFGNGKPILFETMVFGKDKNGKCDYRDQECERYTTWDEAIKGHNKMVSRFMEKKEKAEGGLDEE